MRAIKIDPVAKTITEINLKKNPNKTLEEVGGIISGYVELVELNRNICLLCDEEGRLKNIRGAFTFFGCPGLIICGTAIVLGDRNDRLCPLRENMRSFELAVQWLEPEDVPEPQMQLIQL